MTRVQIILILDLIAWAIFIGGAYLVLAWLA